MKLSLLDMVQDILSDMNSDEVNGIDDTVESTAVAKTLRTVYFEQIANRNWPHLRKLITLDNVGDVTRPNYLKSPETVKQMEFFKYDKHLAGTTTLNYQKVHWKDPDSFLRYTNSRNSTNTNTLTVTDFSGSKLLVLNDVAPSFWTSFDDVYIVTDSFDSDVDTTLNGSKSQCLAYINPVWVHDDDFIPDLPIEAFPGLLAEAKSTCFVNIKEMPNQKAEQKSLRQQRWLSRKAWKLEGGIDYPNYGRKSRR